MRKKAYLVVLYVFMLVGCYHSSTAPISMPTPTSQPTSISRPTATPRPTPVETKYQSGRREAEADIERGILQVKTTGMPAEWFEQYKRIFAEDYGVQINQVAGCVVSRDIAANARSYNEVSKPLIEEKYGECIWVEVEERAIEKYLESLAPDEQLGWEARLKKREEQWRETVEYLYEIMKGLEPDERLALEEHLNELTKCDRER